MVMEVHNAFCPIRPPGHHSGPNGSVPSLKIPSTSNGFCIFNNVALGASYAMCKYPKSISFYYLIIKLNM